MMSPLIFFWYCWVASSWVCVATVWTHTGYSFDILCRFWPSLHRSTWSTSVWLEVVSWELRGIIGGWGGPHCHYGAYRASYELPCSVHDMVSSYYTLFYYTYGWFWTYAVPCYYLICTLIGLYHFNIMYILCIIFILTNNYISFYVTDWDYDIDHILRRSCIGGLW